MITIKGSFTLEAAVVVPITMAVMVAVVFLSFLAYDKVTMTAVCDYALMETAGVRVVFSVPAEENGEANAVAAYHVRQILLLRSQLLCYLKDSACELETE